MNRCTLALGCLLGITPAVASAAVSLQIGARMGSGVANADMVPIIQAPREYYFDLTFRGDTIEGRPENEGLFAYDLLLRASPGIDLVRAVKPDNWVFTAPDAVFTVIEADSRHIVVNGINTLTGPLSDITDGTKVARVYFTVDTTRCYDPLHTITLGPTLTAFGSGDPNQDVIIPVSINDPGIVLGCPEPSGLSGLLIGGLLALRRRRGQLALE